MTPGIHSHNSNIPNTRNEVLFNPINSTMEVCTNAYCPHRTALEKERCCALQLTAANRVLEEGQRYLEIKCKRLEAELSTCREEQDKLDTFASQERTRRIAVEKELHTLQLKLKKRSFDTQYSIITQSAEVECLQEEKKLLVEQVLQLQTALNEMVQLNEILQHALRSNDTNYVVSLEKNINTVRSNNSLPNVDITIVHKDDNDINKEEKEKEEEEVSSIPKTTTTPPLSPSNSPLEPLIEIDRDADILKDKVNNSNMEEDISNKSTKRSNSKDSNHIHLNIIQHNDDNNNNGESESVIHSMQGAISELEALRSFLSHLEAKS